MQYQGQIFFLFFFFCEQTLVCEKIKTPPKSVFFIYIYHNKQSLEWTWFELKVLSHLVSCLSLIIPNECYLELFSLGC